MSPSNAERGFALPTALMLTVVLMAMLSAYFVVTGVEMSTTRATMDRARGFYTAEAGLNVRAEEIRRRFEGFELPAGGSPAQVSGQLTCLSGDMGSGDYQCETHALQGRRILTFVRELAGNPRTIIIPRGELYQNLVAMEYGYGVNSTALGRADLPEAILEMHFKSRLVPMFQFAAFYNKDLEILPGPNMSLNGPVHTNGDLYLGCNNTLTINGQTTTSGTLYHGRKNANACQSGGVNVYDPADPRALPACAGGRTTITNDDVVAWNGMIRSGVDAVTVPSPDVLDPVPGSLYWDKADLRVMLNLNGATPAVEIRRADGTVDAARSAALAGCANTVIHTDDFYNNREGAFIDMLDVDARRLLNCIHSSDLMAGRPLDDGTEGGLVWYLGVDGPDDQVVNNYGVRVRNGGDLQSTVGGAPEIRGLTVVSGQAVYVQGDYNAVDKKPAAFLGDSLNVLSNAWIADGKSTLPLAVRIATPTTINAALLAGTDVTGGAEGAPGQNKGAYNGGLENYPRFHETWDGITFTYRGSFVSLNAPRRVDGAWVYGGSQYTAPNRDWGFDTDFRDPAKLPPLSPRFVYLRQDLFERHYEL